MKRVTVLILFLLSLVFGQINLEHTYSNGQICYVKLKNSGEKYYLFDKNGFKLRMYNLDHSVFKTIDIPVAYDAYTPQSVYLVAEDLFTSDNQIGALAIYYNSTNSSYKGRVFSENSNGPIIDIANCNYGSAVQTANGAKLITNEYVVSGSSVVYSSKVYSLPGSLPVSVGGNYNLPERIEIGQSYPNPVNGTITVPYELPAGENEGSLLVYNSLGQEVLNLRVDRNFSNLQLSSERLSAGTYIYNLKTAGKISESKRFTVTK